MQRKIIYRDFGLYELQTLKLCEKQLMKEEACILQVLQKIKTQILSLQVERLQLQRNTNLDKDKEKLCQFKDSPGLQEKKEAYAMDSANDGSPSMPRQPLEDVPTASQLDEAKSSLNTKDLDLSIMNDLDNILKGNFYAIEEEEESSEED